MSKELIDQIWSKCLGENDIVSVLAKKAADRIEQLEAEVEHLERTKAEWRNTAYQLDVQLSASQAREQQLREALKRIADLRNLGEIDPEVVAFEALAVPSDTTALEALIRNAKNEQQEADYRQFNALCEQYVAKAGEAMRERSKGVADCMDDVNGLAACLSNSIRALPGVTLEDLK